MVSRRNFSLSRREMLTACATAGTLAVTSSSLSGLPDNATNQAQSPGIGLKKSKYDNNIATDSVSKALAQTLDQFQTVREIEIDPLIEPGVIFQAASDDAC